MENWEYGCTFTWLDKKDKIKRCQIVTTQGERSKTGQDNFKHIYTYGLCVKHYNVVKDVYRNSGSSKCLGYNFVGLSPKNCTVRDRGDEEHPPPDFMYSATFRDERCQNCQSEKKNANIRSWAGARILKSGRAKPIAMQNMQECMTCYSWFEPEEGVNGPCLKKPSATEGCQAFVCRMCLFGGAPNQGLRKINHANYKPNSWCPLCNSR